MKFKIVMLGVFLMGSVFHTQAQLDNNMKAKLYFTEAQKLYEQGDFSNSLKYIEKAENTLGTTVARILALKITVQYNLGNFIIAKQLIDDYTNNYMQEATQELNDEVLALYINIEEAAEAVIAEKERYGSFTDSRNGQKYKTLKIGNQTWMAENLNYRTGSSWCYDDNSSNCNKYGRLYTWNAALNACPNGWHLPSDAEWTTLTNYLGGASVAGTKMKSTSGWIDGGNGTNESGFSALPGGYRNSSGSFYFLGETGIFWSSTEYNSYYAWLRYLLYNNSEVSR